MLRSVRLAFSLLGLLVGVSTAAAQSPASPPPVGLSLGVRAGYGIPAGKVGALEAGGDDATLSDGVKGMVPLGLDVAFRITPHLSVGASLQYGFGLSNDKEDGGCKDCTISDISFGASAYLHAAPAEKFDPWVGLGLGYELLDISQDTASLGGGSASVNIKGFQFIVLQIGADVATGSAISVGPFFGVSAGRYDSASLSGSIGGMTVNQKRDLARTSWHEWLTLGVQGKFNL
jgi:opacity protein-like surface antigen